METKSVNCDLLSTHNAGCEVMPFKFISNTSFIFNKSTCLPKELIAKISTKSRQY
jgi:hypothetical protein